MMFKSSDYIKAETTANMAMEERNYKNCGLTTRPCFDLNLWIEGTAVLINGKPETGIPHNAGIITAVTPLVVTISYWNLEAMELEVLDLLVGDLLEGDFDVIKLC